MVFRKYLVCTLFALCLAGGGAASGQSISIVSGNGQLNAEVHTSNNLVVLVRDAQGRPVPAETAVKWAVTSGPGLVHDVSSSTDSNGKAFTYFVGPHPDGLKSFTISTVTATYGTASVSFSLTTFGLTNNIPMVQAFITSPAPSQLPFVGAAGQQGSIPVSVKLRATSGTQQGQGVPNVAVTIAPDNPTNPATITCAGGAILTNSAGLADCYPVFGGKIGNGTLTASVGGYANFQYSYKVIAGPPAVLKVISGNKQIGNPGVLLPGPLVTELTDTGGNDLAGVQLVYEVVLPGTLTLSDIRATTDSTGRTSARVTLGNVAGDAQVRVRTADGTVSAIFTVTVNIILASMQKISGDPQDQAIINHSFDDPLVVQVNDSHNLPVLGATVVFVVTSGSATLGPGSVTTNGQGQASTEVIAGPTAGPIVITATTGAFFVTFNLSSRPNGPQCDEDKVFWNGASFKLNWISPGSVATIVCKGLAPGIQGSVVPAMFGPLPTQVAGVTVTFDTVLAPIYSVSNIDGKEMVSVQVPFETAPGSVPVTIAVAGGSTTVNAHVLQAAPAIFETLMSDGITRAVAVRPDGTFVSPTNPVLRGEKIRAYVTGLIPDPGTVVTNQYAPLDSEINITTKVTVGINNAGFPIEQVIYAHNLIGVWEVQFIVPARTPSGLNVPFSMGIPSGGKTAYTQGSHLPVQ